MIKTQLFTVLTIYYSRLKVSNDWNTEITLPLSPALVVETLR
jgi:hypothetical protein